MRERDRPVPGHNSRATGPGGLSRELALRIGLAARALPDTDAERLLDVLTDCIGLPLSMEKLSSLTFTEFRGGSDGEFAGIDPATLKTALGILQGKEDRESGAEAKRPPAIEPYAEGDMPGSIRVAFASNDAADIDGHFGSCTKFLIYQISADEARRIDIRATDIPDGADIEDKNLFRAGIIKDCHLLYVASMGGPAAAKVVKQGIHPIKIPQGSTIAGLIERLQGVIAGAPPPWLAKIMGVAAGNRVRFEREETG